MAKRFVLIALVIIGFVSISLLLYSYTPSSEKTGYVELDKIFSEFTLKKELEKQLTIVKEARLVVIDSLEFQLKLLSKQIQSENQKNKERIALFEVKKDEYLQKKKQFEEDIQAASQQYDKQIITQMNQYVKDYGEKHGYTYIFGADGSGFLMFSKAQNNITEDVKKYINNRYKGNTE
ncbi:MAG: OmpH family outer membrane protein [Bacteroidota bacterium]